MPSFDWSISLGTVLETAVLGVPMLWGLLRMYWMLSEFMPHKHTRMDDGKRAHIIADTIVVYPTKRGD